MRIIEIVATRCHINSISAGAPPQTPLESLQCSPDPLAAFKGPTSRGREKGEGMGSSPQALLIPPGCTGARTVSG